MKHIITTLLLLLLLLTLNIIANNRQDSLLNLLKTEQKDSIKIALLLQLSDVSRGEEKLNYLKKALSRDAEHEHRYFGYVPFSLIANFKIQERKVDSVEYYLDSALYYAKQQNDSIGIAKIFHIYSGYCQFIGNNPKTIDYIKKAKEIYISLKDSFSYYRILNNEALANFKLGNSIEAEKQYLEVITDGQHPRDSWIIAASNLGLGSLKSNESNFKESLLHNLEAYKIWKELNDTVFFCKALNNIGLIYTDLSMHSLAMSSFQEVIDINPEKDPYALPLALANISKLYAHKKNYTKANSNINFAIQEMNHIGNIYYKMVFMLIKGNILIEEGRYSDAAPLLKEGLAIAEKHNFSNDHGIALTLYAEILYKKNKKDNALIISKQALSKSQQNANIKHQYKNNYLIGKILAEQGQTARATPFLLRSLELNDSIKMEENNENIQEAAINYELGKKEAINQSLKKEAELKNIIIEKKQDIVDLQKKYIVIIAFFLILSLFLLIIVIRNNSIKRKINQRLSATNKKLQELININSKILSIISHDLRTPMISLHSSLMILKEVDIDIKIKEKVLKTTEQQVYATLELLDNLLKWAKTHDEKIQIELSEVNIASIVDQNVKLINNSLLNKEIALKTSIPKHINANTDINLISVVLRNLLSNAIKFTPRKGLISISCQEMADKVVLMVSDTGAGISKAAQKSILSTDTFISTKGTEKEPGSGLGLKLCLNYIKDLNGEFEIKSELKKGSTFMVTLPTQAE